MILTEREIKTLNKVTLGHGKLEKFRLKINVSRSSIYKAKSGLKLSPDIYNKIVNGLN